MNGKYRQPQGTPTCYVPSGAERCAAPRGRTEAQYLGASTESRRAVAELSKRMCVEYRIQLLHNRSVHRLRVTQCVRIAYSARLVEARCVGGGTGTIDGSRQRGMIRVRRGRRGCCDTEECVDKVSNTVVGCSMSALARVAADEERGLGKVRR